MQIVHKLQTLVHKVGVDKDDWNKVHPHLLVIADYLIAHCETYGLPIVFTSIIRKKLKVSISKTHEEGRAFDISVRGWSKEDIEFLVTCINNDLDVGAVSFSDGKSREAIFEPTIIKNGIEVKTEHLHFQCGR